jgi:twitching motility protein PilT
MRMELLSLLELMVRGRASDLFLKEDAPASFRVDGRLRKPKGADAVVLGRDFMEKVLETVLVARNRAIFDREGEADAAYEVPRLGRFRVNAFRQRDRIGFVFRYIPSNVPSFDALKLPAKQLINLCTKERGLVLLTGIAGSGKSTCLAAMVDYMNATTYRHIVTIEDPIEFVHEDKNCVIEQRELGIDTQSFSSALKHVVRQSPDVILIGEMRDRDTMETALNAAETGHLVLSTLHTVNAVQTVERIIGYFPPHLHELIRMQLALVLEGVISLRLLRRQDGPGRVPAVEILLNTPTVRDHLQQGKTRLLPNALRDGSEYFGSQTFHQSLKELMRLGIITEQDAMSASDSPDELRMELKGIARGGDMRIT